MTASADPVLAYLRRLHLAPEPPSAAALGRLMEAHARHVPYETVWLYLDDRRGISAGESLRHVVAERRGGYCYQLNGAFCWLLRQLGYHATLHRSSVHGPEVPAPMQLLNHAGLLVHDLPDESNPPGHWIADVGLGDGPNAPLPLVDGVHDQSPFRWEIGAPAHRLFGFDFEVRHGPRGSFNRVGFGAEVTSMRPFVARHRWLSTSSDSGFRRAVVAQRREGSSVVSLRGRVFSRLRRRNGDETTIDDAASWFTLLADEFGILLSGVPARRRQRLWRVVSDQHDRWLAQLAR